MATDEKPAAGPAPLSSLQSFLLLLGGYRNHYAVSTACLALISGTEALVHPLLLRGIFDAVSVQADYTHFVYLVVSYLALGLSMNGLSYALSLWQLRLDNKIIAQTSSDLLHAFFGKDYRNVLREGSGYYVARIRSDVKDGLVPMLALVRKMAASAFTFVTLISVLIFLSWRAFLVLSAIIPVATVVSIAVSRKIRALTDIERDNEAIVVDTLTRAVGAFKIVRGFMMVPETVHAFSRKMDYVLEAGYKKFRIVTRLQRASDLTMVISDVCSIFVGALFVFRKQMTLGSFIAFMNAFWRAATLLISIFNQWAELHGYSATINRLVAFMHEAPAVPYHRTGTGVSATAISYRYGDTPILANFSLHLAPGNSVLIIGQNGSGKTTLANILAGYLVPSAGQLELPPRINAVTLPTHFPPAKVDALPADRRLLALFGIDGPDSSRNWPWPWCWRATPTCMCSTSRWPTWMWRPVRWP
jgi:subfamily B ATP-binding cassette protein MsbA